MRPRPCSAPAAPRRCGRARPTRRARSAPGCCWPTQPARRSPTSSSCSSTRPRSSPAGAATGFLVTEAIRGEGAKLLDARRRALRRRARAARRGGARDRTEIARHPGSERRRARHAPRRPGAVPERRRGAAAGRHRPRAQLIPVAPAAHYMMGGIPTDLHARSTVPGLLRRRRVCLHRAARRQPAGLELAERVLRVRRTRGACGARRAAAAELGHRRLQCRWPAGPRHCCCAPIRRVARATVARRRARRDGPGLSRLLDDPHPLVRLIATAALARTESRGAHWRHDFPRPTRRSTSVM